MTVQRLPEHATVGDKYYPAMEITEQAEADEYFEELVRWNMAAVPGRTREKSEAIEHGNLGHFAGYYDDEKRARVERLFRCSHPIFGGISQDGSPTADEALRAGKRLAVAPAGRRRNDA